MGRRWNPDADLATPRPLGAFLAGTAARQEVVDHVVGTPPSPEVLDGRDLHPLVLAACDPAFRGADYSTPWVEGADVWATDGAILVRQPSARLDPEIRAALPGRTPGDRRPRDIAAEVQRLHPTVAAACELPEADPTPPRCPGCKGSSVRPLYPDGTGSVRCARCGGTGRAPRSGDVVDVAGWLVDRWYVALLRAHGARAYPPQPPRLPPRGLPKFAFRFLSPPAVGWVVVAGLSPEVG